MAKVLLVEDSPQMARSIAEALTHERYTVEVTGDGQQAYDLLKLCQFDLIVLDRNLPGLSGVEICARMRQDGNVTPVLMLTGAGELKDKEAGFEAGADDYLTKPFEVKELLLRVGALLRRSARLVSFVIECGDLVLDTRKARVLQRGRVVKLTRQEYSVLEFLMRHSGQAFGADVLLERVWRSESESTVDSVRQCIRRLRQKLHVDGCPPVIISQPGLGYMVERNDSG